MPHLSRAHRHVHGAKPPVAAEKAYRLLLLRGLKALQQEISDRVTRGWRHDSTTAAKRLMKGIDLVVDPKGIDAIAKRVVSKNAREMQRLVGISLHSDVGIGAAVEGFRETNVRLITDMSRDMLDDVESLLDTADREAWSVSEIADAMKERFDVSDSRAELIARDQVLKLNGSVTRLRQTNAGVTKYVWTTSRDQRVRPDHADLDGNDYRWDAPPVTNDAGDTNHPGEDYQCRCTAFPLIEGLDDDEAESDLD